MNSVTRIYEIKDSDAVRLNGSFYLIVETHVVRVVDVDLIIELVTGYKIKAVRTFVVDGTHSFVTVRNIEYLFVAYLIDAFPETIFVTTTKSFDDEVLFTVNDHHLKGSLLLKDLNLEVRAHVIEVIDSIVN